MAGKVFTVAQQKGGAGKTTLAVHLAVSWHQAGYRVAVVDIDPQGSLTQWYRMREATLNGDTGLAHVQITGWRTQREVEKLVLEHELVVIDSPPHAQTEARIAVRAASLVVVPIQPSPMDLWATAPTLTLAREEKVPVLMVLNRVPPRTVLAAQLTDGVAALGAGLAETRITNRPHFAAALFEGRSVTETGRRTAAAAEMRALAAEVLARGKK
jgi:chromosome partitioning protein